MQKVSLRPPQQVFLEGRWNSNKKLRFNSKILFLQGKTVGKQGKNVIMEKGSFWGIVKHSFTIPQKSNRF